MKKVNTMLDGQWKEVRDSQKVMEYLNKRTEGYGVEALYSTESETICTYVNVGDHHLPTYIHCLITDKLYYIDMATYYQRNALMGPVQVH